VTWRFLLDAVVEPGWILLLEPELAQDPEPPAFDGLEHLCYN
jgi:hypothetical protein